jgi:hypothetical protein
MRSLHPLVLAALFVLAACKGPSALFPGGALEGPVAPVPGSFDFARDAGTVQLETRPEDPYSVNIACTVVGEGLYVNAGGTRTQWVENIEGDPRVRLRVEGTLYELRAERVTDAAEMDAFAEAWLQNVWARDPRGYDEAFVYRLTAR